MTRLISAAFLAGLLAMPALAQDEAPAADQPDTSAAAIVADCSARKFETSVEIEKDGEKRQTKLKLCAVANGDAEQWVRTLRDAKAKIAGHPDISEESKTKIAIELDAEIAKTEMGKETAVSPPVAVASPAPAAPPVATKPVTAAPSPARALTKPRLTIRCLEFGERGDGSPCAFLGRDTRLAIRADADLTGSTSLRFLRRGDARGEIALAAMRQGQSIRTKLPQQLCKGVSYSKVEIQVLRSKQVVDTLGPYTLHC